MSQHKTEPEHDPYCDPCEKCVREALEAGR